MKKRGLETRIVRWDSAMSDGDDEFIPSKGRDRPCDSEASACETPRFSWPEQNVTLSATLVAFDSGRVIVAEIGGLYIDTLCLK